MDHITLGYEALQVLRIRNFKESDSLIEIITKSVDGLQCNYTIRIKT